MKFRYVGEEYTEWFGFKWMTGTVHDVTDEHAVKKLSGRAHFEKVEGEEPKKTQGGRRPRAQAPEQET